MADALIIEAVMGVFGVLIKAVLETIKGATLFEEELVNLKRILEGVAPKIERMRRNNYALGHSNKDLDSLKQKMEVGTELVNTCSKIKSINARKKARNQQKLRALADEIEQFFNINLQAEVVERLQVMDMRTEVMKSNQYITMALQVLTALGSIGTCISTGFIAYSLHSTEKEN